MAYPKTVFLIRCLVIFISISVAAGVIVPNVLRARRRSQATRILEDLRMVDANMTCYDLELSGGSPVPWTPVPWADVRRYLKHGTPFNYDGSEDLSDQVALTFSTTDAPPPNLPASQQTSDLPVK